MNKSWTLLSLISALLLLSTGYSHAQVVANKAVLQQASQIRAREENAIRKMALDMAQKNGWPLILRFKNNRIATLRGVNSRGLPIYVTTTDNIISAATIRTNTLWAGGSTGLNLNGSSSFMTGKIAVWDEGKVRPTHVELNGRINQVDGSATLSDHSTHVSGTMIATGVNPSAKGMSNGTHQLEAYDYNNDESEMMAAAPNLLVSNHSYADIAGWNYDSDLSRWEWYGEPGDSVDIKFGLYDDDTRIWDSIAYNAPGYLICKAAGNNRGETGPAAGSPYYRLNASGALVAAGNRSAVFGNANYISNNDGYNIIATYGCSKNVLTLGAVNPIPGGYSQVSDVVLADFSSWGPTGDGRIKPDLVADGVNVLSSISTSDNAYDIYSGTSMATPATAGSSFLAQEYYYKLHTKFMRAATLKGLLIHTADEAGPAPGPDYQYGWGLINMQKAVSVITSDTMATNKDQIIQENQLTNSSEDADSITVVASGKVPLTATICWTDPPAVDAVVTGHNFKDTVRKLVNDLDLRITDLTTNTVSMPWVLNPASPASAATTGDNIRDNVEKIEVDSLIPGRSYKIKISHKGTLARTTQAYSLLISGVGGTAYCTSTSTGAAGTYISNVSFSNVNNANIAACHTYSDFTGNVSGALPIGQTIPLNITYQACSGSGAATRIAVYIDYNNNGVFTDAGELVAQSGALTSTTGAQVYSTSIVVPSNVTVNTFTRMRIVAQDGASSAPLSCGTYTAGETQDYRVRFTTPSTDVGVADLEYPTATSCASDSQIVTIRIRNYGTTAQNNVPVTTVVKNGATTVATLTANCTDTIPPKSDVIFTYSTTFPAVGGNTYTFTSQTALASDLNTGNDQNVTSVTASASTNTPTGTATICGASGTSATLTATATGNDVPLWYTTATGGTPIAAGASATTTTIPSNKTYYLGLNDVSSAVGPTTKLTYGGGLGSYFRFGGNFIQFTTYVPLTLQSARMYFAHSGQLSLTLATLATWSGESYSYYPLYTTSLDVYATKPVPTTAQQTNITTTGDNTDTGGLFNLNIPVPTPGTYILIIDCSDSTSTFVNVLNSGTIPYPLAIPDVISINKNSFKDDGKADSLTYYKQFYFPFYDLKVSLNSCPATTRTTVTATTEASPTITLNGGILTSSAASGNQWYRDSVAISGATGQTDSAIYSGKYFTIVTDPVTGCQLQSNIINFVSTGTNDLSGATIGLQVSPNPNPGVFQVIFNVATKDNTSLVVYNTLGQKVYEADYPNYVGAFSNQVSAANLASGVYTLEIIIGNTTYVRRILVKK